MAYTFRQSLAADDFSRRHRLNRHRQTAFFSIWLRESTSRSEEDDRRRLQVASVSLESTQFRFCRSIQLLLSQCSINVKRWCKKMRKLHELKSRLLQHTRHFSITCYFACAEMSCSFWFPPNGTLGFSDIFHTSCFETRTAGICSSCQYFKIAHPKWHRPLWMKRERQERKK